eukprot:COSAG05_NODE_420_length_9974_cov_12.733975_15_plen_194_part_00
MLDYSDEDTQEQYDAAHPVGSNATHRINDAVHRITWRACVQEAVRADAQFANRIRGRSISWGSSLMLIAVACAQPFCVSGASASGADSATENIVCALLQDPGFVQQIQECGYQEPVSAQGLFALTECGRASSWIPEDWFDIDQFHSDAEVRPAIPPVFVGLLPVICGTVLVPSLPTLPVFCSAVILPMICSLD